MYYSATSSGIKTTSLIMYVDMNSYFASCEQQLRPELRGQPIGVVPFISPTACVIAPSKEAKKFGVRTGMRLNECKELCPQIIAVDARPVKYREFHIQFMEVLKGYCDDVLAKSIDEAVMNLTSYRLVYTDVLALAKQIKAGIMQKCGDHITCSIGIAPNSFLAKLGTELQKPDGLVQITPENIDENLAGLKLTDLPGIAARNERRLQLVGIKNPLQMRHTSEALLRKAFGGVVGNYWHRRLNFGEVDMYSHDFRTMSATRMVSRQQRESKQALESLLIALCTKLEQRMVKQGVFCNEASFYTKYLDGTGWDTHIRFAQPVQDAQELRKYILQRAHDFEQSRNTVLFSNKTQGMGVAIMNFKSDKVLQYSLFDNRIRQDVLRKAMYNIKDRYGKNSVRKACELFDPKVMRDAIGFGSVKDLVANNLNQYMLEED